MNVEHHESKYSVLTHTLDPWGGVKRSNIFLFESCNVAYQIKGKLASKNFGLTHIPDVLGWVERSDIERTSDTLIGYLPIFQMLPKFSLCIRYRWYSFE